MNELKMKGIETVIWYVSLLICCIPELFQNNVSFHFSTATNDAFVMEAWGRTSGGAGAGIRFLADDSGELCTALGLSMETGCLVRSKRYSLVAEDGVVIHYFSSAEQASDTWAPKVVSAL